MLIFSYKCGQLGNRLFAYAHIIAAAEANGLRVINLSFDEYAQFFEGTHNDLLCRYPPSSSLIKSNRIRSYLFVFNKAILKLLRLCKLTTGPFYSILIADLPEYQFADSRYFDLKSPSFLNMAKSKAILLFGRFFRDYENVSSHQEVIRRYFTPVKEISDRTNDFIENVRKDTEILVGVHMRRGDYAQFVDGKYFYSQVEYKMKMEELLNACPGLKIKFVVCSNENIDMSCFESIDVSQGPGQVAEDLYVLAKCDYIMGPPSTFTLWAAFFGKKPIYQIKSLQDRIELKNFEYLPPEILFNFSFN
jgi:hypothetical protein